MQIKHNFLVNNIKKTKTWWIFFVSFFFVLVPLLILWILYGEFNLLKNYWLVAKNSNVWHGIVSQNKIEQIANQYGKFYKGGVNALKIELENWIGKNVIIKSNSTFFKPIILAPIFGLIIWSFCLPFIFYLLKISWLDLLPFSTATSNLICFLILSGLIPHFSSNWIFAYWIIRLIICFIITSFLFILITNLTNKYLLKKDYAIDILFSYKKQNETKNITKKNLKNSLEIFKNNKDESFVEIENEE